MTYVDGYLIPVRADRRAAYLEHSARMAAVYREHGALRLVDCWGPAEEEPREGFHAEGARDGLGEDAGMGSMRQAAGAGEGEVVVLSWTEWPDKAARDAGLAKVLADPRVQPRDGEAPVFEGRRLIAGGFDVALDV